MTRKLMELSQKYPDKESQGKWKLFFQLELQAFGGTAALTGYLSTEDTQNTLNLQDSFISETLAIDRPLWCFPFTGTWVITHQLNPIHQIIYKHCKNKCWSFKGTIHVQLPSTTVAWLLKAATCERISKWKSKSTA